VRRYSLYGGLILLGLLAAMIPVSAQAASLLMNPGFELDAAGQNQNLVGWTLYGPNNYNETGGPAHSGTNYFKVYQGFSGAINYSGIFQDYISGPGAVYAADGWAYTAAGDALTGQNAAWIEVSFRDASGTNVLALYRSSLITTNGLQSGAFPKSAWVDLPVTNQYNPNSFQITNTSATLTAPAGTYFVRYQLVFQGDAANSAGSVYFDDVNLSQTGGAPYGNWNIVWSDEFNGGAMNPAVWTYDLGTGCPNCGWGNNELEYYTNRVTNVYLAGGLLHIAARKESLGGQNYTSARVKSQGLFSFKYGRLEWRARLPAGVGCWPALWLLGTNITSVSWPGCGEIDVVENNGSNLGTVQGSLHSGTDETGYYNFLPGDSATNFHAFTLDWNTNALLFYVDGHLYQSQTSWGTSLSGQSYPFPFDQPFFIIMNLAIGGNYLGNPTMNAINAGTVFPAEMQVDYVRIYNQTAPLKISLTQTNGGLKLSWPGNIVCHLQAQSAALNRGLAATWIDLTNSAPPVMVLPTNTAIFYRLASP